MYHMFHIILGLILVTPLGGVKRLSSCRRPLPNERDCPVGVAERTRIWTVSRLATLDSVDRPADPSIMQW